MRMSSPDSCTYCLVGCLWLYDMRNAWLTVESVVNLVLCFLVETAAKPPFYVPILACSTLLTAYQWTVYLEDDSMCRVLRPPFPSPPPTTASANDSIRGASSCGFSAPPSLSLEPLETHHGESHRRRRNEMRVEPRRRGRPLCVAGRMWTGMPRRSRYGRC